MKKERRGIHLIAELANVSIGTVDRALHGRGGIKQSTRHRILQVARQIDSTPSLLRNVVKNGNHWLTLKLIGGPKSPRDAVGAKVFLTAGGVRQRADVFSGGSYGSSSDQRIHFGLGATTRVDKIEIHWPSGVNQLIAVQRVDQIVPVEEGKPTPATK